MYCLCNCWNSNYAELLTGQRQLNLNHLPGWVWRKSMEIDLMIQRRPSHTWMCENIDCALHKINTASPSLVVGKDFSEFTGWILILPMLNNHNGRALHAIWRYTSNVRHTSNVQRKAYILPDQRGWGRKGLKVNFKGGSCQQRAITMHYNGWMLHATAPLPRSQ